MEDFGQDDGRVGRPSHKLRPLRRADNQSTTLLTAYYRLQKLPKRVESSKPPGELRVFVELLGSLWEQRLANLKLPSSTSCDPLEGLAPIQKDVGKCSAR